MISRQRRSFFVKKVFFKEVEKVSAFLANSTPVIRRIKCQKTFEESPRSVCNFIHAFDITTTGIGYTCRWEEVFELQWKIMKTRNFAEKEKTNVHRLTHKAYQFGNSNRIWWTLRTTNHQQKLILLPGDENWKWTKKCRNRGCSTFGKLKLVDRISAVAAFKQLKLVVTWLVIVAGP